MQNRFKLQGKKESKLQHLVVVDDVATTGSTLETCVRILRDQFPGTKISIVVLAVTE
jgi:competence protein ComFC